MGATSGGNLSSLYCFASNQPFFTSFKKVTLDSSVNLFLSSVRQAHYIGSLCTETWLMLNANASKQRLFSNTGLFKLLT
jgi:hypothetical protein